jgi:hypothetical protein
VVQERHPHLEGVGHGGAVEVLQHVVDQGEPPVEVERGRERVAAAAALGAEAGGQGRHGAHGGPAGLLGQRAPEQLGAQPGVDAAAHRQQRGY